MSERDMANVTAEMWNDGAVHELKPLTRVNDRESNLGSIYRLEVLSDVFVPRDKLALFIEQCCEALGASVEERRLAEFVQRVLTDEVAFRRACQLIREQLGEHRLPSGRVIAALTGGEE